MASIVSRLLELLTDEYGDPNWWPGDTSFEIAVGAILTQRASWDNVEAAIARLKEYNLLDPEALSKVDRRKLELLIRPSGFYRQKARYLLALADLIQSKYSGHIDLMRRRPIDELRAELLELPGIGPETADSILLYALGKPSFVVDAYTIRLLKRLSVSLGEGYDSVKRGFELALGDDSKKYSLMHALIVTHCKTRCKMSPICGGCPLTRMCPSKLEK